MTNCRTGTGDEALSFWFLMQWLLSDVTNLIGAVLTRQLATQVREWERVGEGGKERVRGYWKDVYIINEMKKLCSIESYCVFSM